MSEIILMEIKDMLWQQKNISLCLKAKDTFDILSGFPSVTFVNILLFPGHTN